MVGQGKKVLEIGCASGYISRILKEKFNCDVTGIDINPEDVEKAQEVCVRVITGDVERLDFDEVLEEDKFDVVTFGDVLEHLRDPLKVLTNIRGYLNEGGYVVASIPNIAHLSVILGLLEGEFRYRDLGLLDSDHIRFFTKKSIHEMFRNAGYDISHWERVTLKPEDTELETVMEKFPHSLLSFLGDGGELSTYQYIVKALPSINAGSGELQEFWEKNYAKELRQKIVEQKHTIEDHELRIRELADMNRVLSGRVEAMLTSNSWKITAPMRRLMGIFKRDGDNQ